MKNKTLTLLTGVILLLVLVAAATGVFYQTPGAHIDYVTVRGEHATYQGDLSLFYPTGEQEALRLGTQPLAHPERTGGQSASGLRWQNAARHVEA